MTPEKPNDKGPEPEKAEAPLPYVCLLHGNTQRDVAVECSEYELKDVPNPELFLRSCLNCKSHSSNQPKEIKGVFITPRQRQYYIDQARDWWNRTGRHMVSQEKNSERTKRKFREARAGAPAILTHGVKENVIPSGILNGKMYDNLRPEERGRVLKIWMHHYTPFKFPDLTKREHDLRLESVTEQVIKH